MRLRRFRFTWDNQKTMTVDEMDEQLVYLKGLIDRVQSAFDLQPVENQRGGRINVW